MHIEETRTAVKALTELSEGQKDFCRAMKDTSQRVGATKKLWKEGNKSRLIKIGIALIVFPDPSPVTEIIGAGFVAAGMVHKGIQNRSIYMEDIAKAYKETFKELCSTKYDLQM